MRPLLIVVALLAAAGCGSKKAESPVSHDPHPPAHAHEGVTRPAAQESICGEVRIKPELAAKVPSPTATLFVFAKSHTGGGPPAAAIRADVIGFPLSFCLSKKDAMAPGVEFAGKHFVTARIDMDGNAGGAPGDLEGVTREAVPVGTTDLVLVIDTVRS